MLNRIFKKLETTGRLNIPQELLKFVNINNGDQVAICTDEKSGGFKIKSLSNAYNDKIIGISSTDSKGRFVFPRYLFEKENDNDIYFEIYILKSELIVIESSV